MSALVAAIFVAASAHAQLLELPPSAGIDPVEVETILRVELSGRALDGFRFTAVPAPDGAIALSAMSTRSESRTMSLAGVEPSARARLVALLLVELARLASNATAPSDDPTSEAPALPSDPRPSDPARSASASVSRGLVPEAATSLSAPVMTQAYDDERPGVLRAPPEVDEEALLRLDIELGLRAFFLDLTVAPSFAFGIDIANAVTAGARVIGFVYENDVGSIGLVQATAWTSVRLFSVDFGARFAVLLRGELGYAHAFGQSDTPGISASEFGGLAASGSVAPELTWKVGSTDLRLVVDLGFQYGIAPTALGQTLASFHGVFLGTALGFGFDV